ncbi:MAG: UDP-2,3-diacylglucosamine diphosphatase [Chromatiales bacterium]|nr:UDP-2,3-diacylglucosamine diphosphatase [Chromatiales bacterium]
MSNESPQSPSSVTSLRPNQYRTIFISDVHLGFRGCQAEYLLDFLHSTKCDYLYLVGDIVDVWNMKRGIYWPQPHNNVVRSILGKAKHETKVIFIPGNHDEVFRDHAGLVFGNVAIKRDDIHTTAAGKRLLVLHGDEFDSVVKCAKYLSILGNHAYDWLLALNRHFNALRRRLGLGYWSLAAYLKHKVKNAVSYISNFEDAVTREVQKRQVDGLVCGHIHHAAIKQINGLDYLNCGDWVESCTALVEHYDGRIELIDWIEQTKARQGDEIAFSEAKAKVG